MQKVGIAAFYQIVSLICEDTQRHPPTRQFFTSCVEILGQVESFIKVDFLFTCIMFSFVFFEVLHGSSDRTEKPHECHVNFTRGFETIHVWTSNT